MRVGLSCLFLGALLVPTLANADDHWADAKAALARGKGSSTLTGLHVAFAKELHDPILWGNVAPIGDFSIQWGSDVTQVIYMGGLRATIGPNISRHKFHVQGLLGFVYTDAPIASGNDFAVAGSFAYEFVVTGLEPGRMTYDRGWGIGLQADAVRRFGDRDDTFGRYSLGVVYRWPRPMNP